MKNYRGLWLPDSETHLIEWMDRNGHVIDGKPTYQYHKLEAALKWVKAWRVAVDVGAHCGLWSMHLVKRFQRLYAFEPVAAHRECFERNVGAPHTLFPWALGEREGRVAIRTAPTSSGDSWVSGEGEIPMLRLDDVDPIGSETIDFIKLDCEGYELFALRGAESTLKRCRPCVIVEQKPGHAQKFGLPETGAVDYLRGLGAILRAELAGDFILSWD